MFYQNCDIGSKKSLERSQKRYKIYFQKRVRDSKPIQEGLLVCLDNYNGTSTKVKLQYHVAGPLKVLKI